MKILFLEWKSYCVPDMAEAFTEAGHDVTLATCAEMTDRYNTEFDIFFEKKLSESSYGEYPKVCVNLQTDVR